jgi:hypothetical protein
MKTTIKNAARAALTLITVSVALSVAVLSCNHEAKLSDIKWDDVNKQYDGSYTNALSLSINSVDTSVNTNVTPPDLEVTLNFPNNADFLKSGGVTADSMKSFMSIYSFTDNATSGHPSVQGAAISFELVGMERGDDDDTTDVTIKLVNPSTDKNAVIKIDGTKFTFADGKKMDANGDSKQGEAIYDDLYLNVKVDANTTTFIPPGKGGSSWRFYIYDITASTPSGPAGERTLFRVAEFDAYPTFYDYSTYPFIEFPDAATIQTEVMTFLLPKLKLEKYNTSARNWEAATGTFSRTGTTEYFQLEFTPESLTHYRVKAKGMKQLTTSSSYWGYIRNTVVSNSVYWTHDYENQTNNSWIDSGNSYKVTDSQGKNMVLHLVVKGIPLSTDISNPYYLPSAAPDLATFKKNFKIAYKKEGGTPNLSTSTDIRYIDITDVKYKTSSYTLGTNIDEIEITLDPNYKETSDQKYFVIAPGFKYSNNKIIFGDPSNLTNAIDGVPFFRVYTIPTGLSF